VQHRAKSTVFEVTFNEPNLVANAGLLLVATLTVRLELERLINATVHLSGRVGGALPGRKVLTVDRHVISWRCRHAISSPGLRFMFYSMAPPPYGSVRPDGVGRRRAPSR